MRVWEIPEFETGLIAGLFGGAALLSVALLAWVLRHRASLPLGGIAFALAGMWSVDRSYPMPNVVVVGLVGVAIAAWLGDIPVIPTWVTAILALPFAWGIGFDSDVSDVFWIQATVVVGASAAAVLVAATDAQLESEAVAPALLAITVAGVYFAVPDTEGSAALLGAIVLLPLLGWPLRAVRLGRPGAAAATALIVWVAANDGRARPASIIASAACLGLLACLPIGRALLPRAGRALAGAHGEAVVILVALAHLVVVAIASRVAGPLDDVSATVLIVGLVGVGAVVVSALVVPGPPPRRPPVAPHSYPRPRSQTMVTRR